MSLPLVKLDIRTWDSLLPTLIQQQAIEALEHGNLILLPQLAFDLLAQEKQLVKTDFQSLKAKNISFDRKSNTLRGLPKHSKNNPQLKAMLRRFSEYAFTLMHNLFPHYRQNLQIARTSYRPIETYGRVPASYRKDDTRLHVDAFPSTPLQGRRLIRIFCNINLDQQPRIWKVGEPFEKVARRFLPALKRPWPLRAWLFYHLKLTRGYSTEYDYMMLQIHNKMKADLDYQKNAQQTEIALPSGSTWIVQTDEVSHAALKGQHLLEQTFYLPHNAMQTPQRSPLHLLEKLTGRTLTSPIIEST